MRSRVKDLLVYLGQRVVEDGDCWIWTGPKNSKGYGIVSHEKYWYKSKRAHRVFFEIYNNREIKSGLIIRHTCDNPSCVNPKHLLEGTQKENVEDRDRRTGHFNSLKTHCNQGHEFTRANTYIDLKGHRECRECRRNHYQH